MGRRDRAQALRSKLGDRRCPLCGQQAWDFDGIREVFLIDTDLARVDSVQQRLNMQMTKTYREYPERALIQEFGKEFDKARGNRLVQLSCDNCGHTELLDAGKLGA